LVLVCVCVLAEPRQKTRATKSPDSRQGFLTSFCAGKAHRLCGVCNNKGTSPRSLATGRIMFARANGSFLPYRTHLLFDTRVFILTHQPAFVWSSVSVLGGTGERRGGKNCYGVLAKAQHLHPTVHCLAPLVRHNSCAASLADSRFTCRCKRAVP
jgi:hypothetical protein